MRPWVLKCGIALWVLSWMIDPYFGVSKIKLILILPWTQKYDLGESTAGGFLIGLDDLRKNNLTTETHFEWRMINADCNNPFDLISKVVKETTENNSTVLLGVGCQSTCYHLAQLSSAFNTPFISIGCMESALSNGKNYPTLVRTVPDYGEWLNKIVIHILITFGWKRVVFARMEDSSLESTERALKDALQKANIVYNSALVIREQMDLSSIIRDGYS